MKLSIKTAINPLFVGLLLAACSMVRVCDAITMPSPPPELPDTLTKFRTLEQLNEGKRIDRDSSSQIIDSLEVESAPFVPGDDVSGILRIGYVYTPEATVGVPSYGASIIRFYDLEGIPWDISSVRTENQGFSAEVTASPSELLIKQGVGATSSKMVVTLDNHDSPLVFTLSPVRLKREGVMINTIISTVRVKSYTNIQGYVYPQIEKIPKPNPSDSNIKAQG
ncbi:MAG: hypothetical protein ACI4UM_07745, partial [Succinivibrio sp.]